MLVGRLTGLERLKLDQQVRGAGLNNDPEETAREIQAVLDDMEAITNGSRWEGWTGESDN